MGPAHKERLQSLNIKPLTAQPIILAKAPGVVAIPASSRVLFMIITE